ncbi:MAG: RHS repeat-associated core domain-containing protein, partial [Alphaproteobacteria bacterium]|nr:RHS repeat-associated core domain-containing protein [Alphaproteobacteria bacterium]
ALGADYQDNVVVVGARMFNGAGRIAFEAYPYAKSDPLPPYGTNYYYNDAGDVFCAMRSQGPQPLVVETNLALEIFPTCFRRSYSGRLDTLDMRDSSSLQKGSPQEGTVQRIVTTAIGRAVEQATSQPGTRIEHATYSYDRLGQLVSMQRFLDPVGDTMPVQWSRQMDSTGNVLTLTEPATSPRSFTYSDWGEPLQTSWMDGTVSRALVRSYDSLGRLIGSVEQSDGVVDPATVNTYAYDAGVAVTPLVNPTFTLGRLSQATSPNGQTTFSYDAFGRINAQVFTDAQSVPYVQTFGNHSDGRIASLSLYLPDQNHAQELVQYGYDSAGTLRTVNFSDPSGSQQLYTAQAIDPLGRVLGALYGANIQFEASYAPQGRRLITSAQVGSPSGSRSITFGAFDPAGRELVRTEVTDGAGGGVQSHVGYDALGRVAMANQSAVSGTLTLANWTFGYDALGNINTLYNTVGSSFTNLNYQTTDSDRICQITYGIHTRPEQGCHVDYDAAGNIVQQPTRTGSRQLSYFLSGSVRSITQGGSTAGFGYDAFGRMQTLDTQANAGQTVHESHFGDLIDRLDSTSGSAPGSLITRRIPGPNGIFASRRGTGNDWIFEFSELRGKRFFANLSGKFVQDVLYQPFGEATSTGASAGSTDYTSYQWNSGKALASFGLSLLGARLYDPAIGRFTSRDPLLGAQTAATSNPYAFAANDPVNAADPTGKDPTCGDDDLCITSSYSASQAVDTAAALGALWGTLDWLAGSGPSGKPTLEADPVLRQVFDDAYRERYQSQEYLYRVHHEPGSGEWAVGLAVGMPVSGFLQTACDLIACSQETGGGDTLVPDGHGGLRPDSYQPHRISYSRQAFNIGMDRLVGKASGRFLAGEPSRPRWRTPTGGSFGDEGGGGGGGGGAPPSGGPPGPGDPAAGGGSPQTYGPYAHQINRGGLQAIMQTRQLQATLGRFGDTSVRAVMAPRGFSAYDGFFPNDGSTMLIFRTYEPPTRYNWPQDWALWERPSVGDTLDIIPDEIHLSY